MFSIVLAGLVLALDQLTKWLVGARMEEFQEIPVIRGFFSLQFVRNPGAAFGMLANQQWLFILVALTAVGAMVYFLRHPEAKLPILKWAMGLLLGGALGNMVDRIRYGKVVDFFLFYWKDYSFPNFNVADIAITVGVGLFVLHLIFTGEKQQREGV
ncbi:MAG TPA: signal peptidase II [Symbiobacteriaceae bacterium]|nr:signal peptidase II [Symbiobacteriaceae bacterium]